MRTLADLRSIVRGAAAAPRRDLTYEPELAAPRETGDSEELVYALGGRAVETPEGPCLAIDRRYDASRYHGSARIGECSRLDEASVRVLMGPGHHGEAQEPRPSRTGARWLFVDLETTGLSGGAGTVPFLVGCGYFEDEAFCIRQLLLPAFRAERALLAGVSALVDASHALVTYNGKTFDLPVLETRWMFHRLAWPFGEKTHLDLLHPARRLWRDRGRRHEEASCTLGALERVLLGVRRLDEVPGFEIPARYFRFLRSGNPAALEGILEHNRTDLLSLAALTARACRLVAVGPDAASDPWECVALGRMYERAGDGCRADECYERTVREASTPSELGARAEALRHLALRHRRGGRHVEAADAWQELFALAPPGATVRREAAEALAVHHEHRKRDLRSARTFALRALSDAPGARHRDKAQHRLARLDRKLAQRGWC